jgi:hypothetical protein
MGVSPSMNLVSSLTNVDPFSTPEKKKYKAFSFEEKKI